MIEIQAKPLSVNKVWKGRRFKTQDYKDYENELLYLIRPEPTLGYVSLSFTFHLTSRSFSRSDLDNFLKPLIDILVKAGCIEDDRKVLKISAEKKLAEEYRIDIEIKEAML